MAHFLPPEQFISATTEKTDFPGATSWTFGSLELTTQTVSFSGTVSQLVDATTFYTTLSSVCENTSTCSLVTMEIANENPAFLTGFFHTAPQGYYGPLIDSWTTTSVNYSTWTYAFSTYFYSGSGSGELATTTEMHYQDNGGNWIENPATFTFFGTTWANGVAEFSSSFGTSVSDSLGRFSDGYGNPFDFLTPKVPLSSIHPGVVDVVSYPDSYRDSSWISEGNLVPISLLSQIDGGSSVASTVVYAEANFHDVIAPARNRVALAGDQVWTMSVVNPFTDTGGFGGTHPVLLAVTTNSISSSGFSIYSFSSDTSTTFSVGSDAEMVAEFCPLIQCPTANGGFAAVNYSDTYFV